MLRSLLGRNRWPIALDIGAESIKMLQMQWSGGALSVRACGRWRLPVGGAETPEARRELVVGAVREMLRAGGFQGNRVISALSGGELKIKNVRVQGAGRGEVETLLLAEARERFGCDFAPDQLHFLRAGDIRRGAENCEEYILLGAPGPIIEDHYRMLLAMGLRPVHIDAEPLAVFRPFERGLRRQADEDNISVIVDLGHSSTKVIVARGRDVVLIKTIPIGGRNFAEAVGWQLNLSYEEACDLRHQIMWERSARSAAPAEAEANRETDPNSVSWTIVDAVRGEVGNLAREIALCLRYCSVTFRGLRPGQIVLTGGEAYDPAMVRLLTDQLGVECVIGQPLRGVDTSGVDMGGDRRSVLAEWGVCAGLALRSEEYERHSRKRDHDGSRLSA